MTEEKEKKDITLHYLIPVQKLPTKRAPRTTLYDNILMEFIEANLRYAEVRETGRKPLTVLYYLRKKLRERGLTNIKVSFRNKKIYLEKRE